MTHSSWSKPSVALADFEYELPADRIAAWPLAQRDRSRLLVCRARTGTLEHHTFADLPSLLPADALLVVNDTRVVRARIVMRKPTGGRVEFFLLEPMAPSHDPAIALGAHAESTWRCLVGGARRVRSISTITHTLPGGETLSAELVDEDAEGFRVRFRWSGGETFAELLEAAGRVPLPPYIKREAEEQDAETYQTVYAELAGSVAAPTAGLHFTPRVLDELREKGIQTARLTLHVGAGTFRQVKGDRADEHEMHRERVSVRGATIERLIEHARRRRDGDGAPFVIVGTTSLRTIESLYWFGARLVAGESSEELSVGQWDPYRLEQTAPVLPDIVEALEAVDRWRADAGLEHVEGSTGIMIVPGYRVRACDALVTNFHQPGSTLVLLVGALLGRDLWRSVYDAALADGYRFLSYGDSSMLVLDDARVSKRNVRD
ncbi:MAG TPA: S-adenosylmethionine:tRNA ribosyltransferase-isomerase [Candidatus Kapabacteria bacterium]|jgi:S-adenosylmethionine:tRNA ribosyltransferase-isomerase|nr:S-adenosylmethionine:tRNA ribosyltransferase-isomerase [Candidatus Kapabacteria bacterium]